MKESYQSAGFVGHVFAQKFIIYGAVVVEVGSTGGMVGVGGRVCRVRVVGTLSVSCLGCIVTTAATTTA
jgi:hypothetical protein